MLFSIFPFLLISCRHLCKKKKKNCKEFHLKVSNFSFSLCRIVNTYYVSSAYCKHVHIRMFGLLYDMKILCLT